VTLISEKFSPDLTSNVAAGIFLWGPKSVSAATDLSWATQSWSWWQDLLAKDEPGLTGVSFLKTYLFSSHRKDQVERPMMSRLGTTYRDCTEEELGLVKSEGEVLFGKYVETVQIEAKIYLQYLMKLFLAAGGKVVESKVDSLDSLGEEYMVVVNCSGLGARYLCGDKTVLPLRGQVLRVSAPWIRTALYHDDVYIIPGQDWVTVGGTRQYNDWMTEVSPHDSARIWSRAVAVFPQLAGAEVVEEVVGLRPHRYMPRVEAEYLKCGLPVIHNYGHCGYGVLSSPGTSQQATDILNKIIRARM